MRCDAPDQVQGVSLTFVDAGHCPGSAMAAFEARRAAGPTKATKLAGQTGLGWQRFLFSFPMLHPRGSMFL